MCITGIVLPIHLFNYVSENISIPVRKAVIKIFSSHNILDNEFEHC